MGSTNEQIEGMKQIQVEILREFVSVCQRLQLRYYLIAGTLLGAVRHRGFIPWDDDIDVAMPRTDYEVFVQKGQALLPDGYFIQTNQTDPEYVNCFAKIRNSNTTFLETTARKMKINHGVFIDVFPLDYYPDNVKDQKKLNRKKVMYERRIGLKYYYNEKPTLKSFLRRLVLITLYPSCKNVIRKRDKLYRTVPESSMLINYGGAWGAREITPKVWYGEGTNLVFEGLTVCAPCQYEKWLTQIYGDYMQLPPVEKRVTHHYTDVIDLHKSYKEYVQNK